MSDGDFNADPFLAILEADMSRISGVDMRRNRIITATPSGETSWYAEEMLRHMAENRRHMWRARVAHAIEEADAVLNEVLMRERSGYECRDCGKQWSEDDYRSVRLMEETFEGHELAFPGHSVMWWGKKRVAGTEIDEVFERALSDPRGVHYSGEAWSDAPGVLKAQRPWPRRRGNQAVSHDWLETVLIALIVVLLLLAAVAFIAPAMLPAR